MNDFLKALKNWSSMLVISKDADINDAVVKRTVATIENAADKALSAFRKDATDSLFLGRMPTESNEMSNEYSQIYAIARAWGSYGTKYYQRQDILEIIRYSLEWMYNNRYGQKEIDGCGWRDMALFNWYDWELSSPDFIINTLMILGDFFTPEDAKRYLKVFDFRVPEPRDYASNKVHYGKLIIGAGLLQQNDEKIRMSLRGIEDTNIFVDGGKNDGQGFYTDGSYIFHTCHPMNGTYGVEHYKNMIEICRALAGTKYEDCEITERICYWTVNAFIPFLSKGIATRSILGRHPNGGYGEATGMKILACATELATFVDKAQSDEILAHVIRNLSETNSDALHTFYSTLSDGAYKLIKSKQENGITPNSYRLNKVFYNEDRVMHHFDGVAYSLSMSSSRIYNYECINHLNMDGWYLGDGMLTAYGSDYEAYTAPYFDHCDPYRRPGTTLDTRQRSFISIAQRNEYLSSQDFVGGVSNGEQGAAAMRLESYHGDGEFISKKYYSPDGEYGGAPEKRECTLLAKKAWFFDKKTAVCLGAEITSQDNAEVITVIDYRKTKHCFKTPSGAEISVSEQDTALDSSIKSLYLEGFGGYYFPEEMQMTIRNSVRNETRFVEAVAHHGVNPQNGSYAYALLPELSEEETKAYADAPGFRILSNSGDVQAVEFDSGIKMYVFWNAGEFDGIETSAPAMVMLDGKRFFVSDPTQKLTCLTVRLGNKAYAFDFTEKPGKTVVAEV